MKKALVVTHGGDIDGIVSAAMLKYLLKKYRIEFIFVIYSIQEEIFEKISRRKDLKEMEVFIADLNCNGSLTVSINGDETIIQRIARRAKSVYWFDHHDGTKEQRQLLIKCGIKVFEGYDDKKCSAKLIYGQNSKYLKDRYYNWLSFVAQNSDYPDGLRDEVCRIGEDLNKIISFYLYRSKMDALRALVVILSRGKDWYEYGKYSSELENVLVVLEEQMKMALVLLEEDLETLEIGGKKIILGFGLGILPTKETIIEVKKHNKGNADCYIITFGIPINGALILTGKNNSFPVLSFCTFLGGGGRILGSGNEMGGFSYKFNLTKESYNIQAKNLILQKINEFSKSRALK